MRRVRNALALVCMCAWLALAAVPLLLFDFVIDRRLARCDPHARFGTLVWHRHSLLLWQWWAVHDEAIGWRMTTRYR